MGENQNSNSKESLVKTKTTEYSSITEKCLSNEKAEVKSKYTHTQWITLATMALNYFSMGAYVSLQAPFFPAEAERKGATPTEYGLIFGMYQLSIFFTAPIIGKIAPYTSPKFLLNSGMLTVGITLILFGILDKIQDTVSFVALAFIIRIVEGIGAAAFRTSCYIIIASQFPQTIGTSFALLETFLGVGLITGPTVGGALYDLGGYGLPFFVVGGVVLLDAVIILFVLPGVEEVKVPEKSSLLKFLVHPKTMMYSLSVFTAFNYIGFNQSTLEPHIRQFQLSGFVLGLMFALSGTVYALTASIWGWLNDKKGNSQFFSLIGCVIMAASILLVGPAPFIPQEPTLGTISASLILMGLSIGAKVVSAFTGTLKDTARRGLKPDISTYGLVSAMIASSQSLGAFVGPSIGGILLQWYGFRYASMALLVLEAVLFISLIVSIVCNFCNKKKSGSEMFSASNCIGHVLKEKRPVNDIDTLKWKNIYLD